MPAGVDGWFISHQSQLPIVQAATWRAARTPCRYLNSEAANSRSGFVINLTYLISIYSFCNNTLLVFMFGSITSISHNCDVASDFPSEIPCAGARHRSNLKYCN